jgi:hypothetical protein
MGGMIHTGSLTVPTGHEMNTRAVRFEYDAPS